jgi:putative DNA primase/helicase
MPRDRSRLEQIIQQGVLQVPASRLVDDDEARLMGNSEDDGRTVVPDGNELLVEDGLALALAGECDANARWVQEWGAWLHWDGAVWVKDNTLQMYDMVRRLCRRAAETAQEKRATELRKAATVAAVERMARSDRRLAAIGEQWDADPWVLNTLAGIVNLHTGAIRPHDPLAYCTKITAVAPGGDCPLWRRFLSEVTDGDAALEAFLQRVIGYSLTGAILEHALFFLYGTGRNGKGVFLNTLKAILDAYATVAPMTAFTDTHHEQHPTDLAMLRGARLVIAQETEEGRNWAESRIKALTGGDPITARFMRQDFFTFTPQFKLLIAGNHKPTLRNVDEAIRGRLHLIPFTVTIPPERRDPELADKLKAEWPGILQWAIDGCLLYQKIGLAPPPAVVNATAEYFEAQDDFSQWLDECCDIGPDYWEPVGRLFESWRNWAEASRLPVGTKKRLSSELDKAGFKADRNAAKGGRYRQRIRLKPSTPSPRNTRPWDSD